MLFRLYLRIILAVMLGTVGPVWAQEPSRAFEVTIANGKPFPVDLSFMNHKPAGALGRVRAAGDALVFGDGSPARFWGVNVQAYALFRTRRSLIAEHAERLARMGVNLVRIHHHDSDWVTPNVFGKKDNRGSALSADSLDKLDIWISELRKQGIYIWLDLHVARRINTRDPQGLDFDEIINGPFEGDLRGYNFVNDDVKTLMQDFNEAYLTHVNPYTGMAYKDDPAIAVVMITNENDLSKHYGAKLLAENGAPNHEARYRALADAFARQHGLDPETSWQFWTWGDAKLFIADLEHRFYEDMTAHLRGLGYEGLITTSNFWGGMSLAALPALAGGDLIDVHSYGRDGDLALDPDAQADLLSNIAAAHVTGLPLSVSEWNIFDGHSADRLWTGMRVASMAAFQDWDAMMLYGYAQRPLRRGGGGYLDKWHAANDPDLITTLPASALIYRMQHVAPAETAYVIRPTAEDIFGADQTADTVAALRHLPQQARVSLALPTSPQLPWIKTTQIPDDAIVLEGLEHAPTPALPPAPFRHEPTRGVFTLDAAQSQVVAGQLNKTALELSGLTVDLAHDQAVVAVQSVSAAGLAQAERVLISVALPNQKHQGRRGRVTSEPLNGTISFDAAAGLQLQSIVPRTRRARITHREENGRHTIRLTDAPGALWLVLAR